MRSAASLLVGLALSAHAARRQLPSHAGTFTDPPTSERIRLRYWLPDGGVDPDVVKADVKSLGSVGGGGLEFLGFFEYGGNVGSMPPGANWVESNFGTPAFQRVFKAALKAHEENGLMMDFPIGPNQGQGVPASEDDDGLQWDLVPYTAAVPEDGFFGNVIPGWRSGELVAFTSALVISEDSQSFQQRDKFDIVNVTYDQYWLQHESLMDHTHQVSIEDGRTTLQFPRAANGTYYRIFSFFQTKTLNKNLEFELTEEMAADTSIFRNGSYAVDHFSARGAETVTKFWEQHILTNGVKELLIKAGNYAWEDSVEVISNISWSRSMADRFVKEFGYSINAYLPLFAFRQNNLVLQLADPGKFECLLDHDDRRQQYLNNFHKVLADGYADYLGALRNWTHSLGKELSVQPAYNLPIDMMGMIPLVDIPECESLGFEDNIDLYRRFVGPAHLEGHRVISNELGALPQRAYQYTIPTMLFSMNRGFAAGVNQYVLHGGQYTGNYYATTWPGHVGFAYLFSEPFSEKQPSWRHGFQDALDYAARVSHVMRAGVPKVDIIKYSKQSITTIVAGQEPPGLIKKGWSYTYLSADNFEHEQAHVVDGILAQEGPAWQAMLVESSENVTVAAIKVLREYTSAGLPVLFSGGQPGFFQEYNDTDEDFAREMSMLMESDNLYEVKADHVADQLSSIGLSPRVGANMNGSCYTSWYDSGDIGYAFVYSDLVRSTGKLIVASTSTPYIYDSWTGERRPVFFYEQKDGKTIIPLDLAGNQTVIIAFSDTLSEEVRTPHHHIVSSSPSVLGAEVRDSTDLTLLVGHSTSKEQVTLSDGTEVVIDGTSVTAAFQLSNWTLVVERWEAPANISDASIIAEKRNTTHDLPELASWDKIPDLDEAAGVGYYSAAFDWPFGLGCLSTCGAFLHVGRVTHAVRVLVNGQRVPPLDIFNPEVNIAPYLRAGKNTVDIVTPTTMWNYLRGMLPELMTAGSSPLATNTGPMEVGLVGPVTVTPFKKVRAE